MKKVWFLSGSAGMSLSYGGKKCRVEVKELTQSSLSIAYSIEELSDVDRVYVNIPLVGGVGSSIKIEDKEELCWRDNYLAAEIKANSTVFL